MSEKRMTVFGFLKVLMPFFKPHLLPVYAILICMAMDLAYSNVVPLMFQMLIDKAIEPHNISMLWLLLGLMAAGAVIVTFSALLQDVLYAKTGTRVMNDIRYRLFSHLQELPMGFYSRMQAGDIMARFSSDLESVENALIYYLPQVIISAVGMVVSVGILFTLDWRLSIISIIGLAVSFLVARVFEKQAAELNYQLKEDIAGISVDVQENLATQAVIKGFNLKNRVLEIFRNKLSRLWQTASRANGVNYTMERVPNIGVIIIGFIVLGIGAFFVFNRQMSVGELVAFYTLFGQVSGSVNGLTYSTPALLEGAAGMERINQILTEEPSVKDGMDKSPLPPLEKEITLENVSFAYTPGHKSLDGVNITIPRGASVAFVGASGSGKSTVLNMVNRFYDPADGAVKYDGRDIRDVTLEALHARMGIVFQENVLFNDTIRENIRMGNLDATDAEVEEAARSADIHDFIMTLPLKYDTRVGERGGNLSGGQRQRVAIARAIIRNPSLILLDEATSALDPHTEDSVNQTIRQIAGGRTVLSVTHRLAPVVYCDKVFVLEKGKVVEQGPHKELLARNGLYARLWNKQQGFKVSDDGESAEVTPARLSSVPLFSGLDQELLEDIADKMDSARCSKGDELIREGESGDRFFVVARGTLEVLKKAPDGHQERVEIFEDGDCFGEIALLKDLPRTATVRALTPVTYLTLKRDHFLRLVGRVPGMRDKLEAMIQARLDENAAVMRGEAGVVDKQFTEKG